MKSITNEPDIPDSLQQIHEDRRVVFLCGAGISVPVQLPHFIRLDDEICKRTSSINTPQEDNALKACQYDATLNLLEHWLPEGRIQVRQALGSALTRCSFLNSATETHAALLYLSKTHDNKMRLDTINLIPYSSVQLNASIIGFLYSVHQCYPCLEGLASQEE